MPSSQMNEYIFEGRGMGTQLRERNAFIPPPLLALIAIPFAALPWTLAIILWNLG